MRRWRTKSALILAGAAAFALAGPSAGQRDKAAPPPSDLPPGFGDPGTPAAPKAAPAAGNEAAPAGPAAPVQQDPAAATAAEVGAGATGEETVVPDETELPQQTAPQIEIPESSRRPTNVVGVLTPDNWGLSQNEFGGANGVFLSSLMRRLNAPLPSRWTSILLRRALLSQIPAPQSVNEVDWVGERAWLLLRMGEADAARMLVQSVDVDRYTPRMFTVAVQAALANADPAGLCPLVAPGRLVSDEPVWNLSDAMCAALQGDSARASQLIDQARGNGGAGGIDLLLAQKVIGAGLNTRRAVTIQWDGVDSLNSWRFGLAAATGLALPQNLMNGAGPQVWAWEARAPMIPLDQRVAAAQTAAALGVFSHASLVELFSLIADQTDPAELNDTLAGRFRKAYAGSADDRLDAMRGLWDDKDPPGGRYARLVLTATAAARIAPSSTYAKRADDLVASMLTAGLDESADRWSNVVGQAGSEADRAWSILAVGSQRPRVDVGTDRVKSFAGHAEGTRGRMLVAALAGLGRLRDPGALGVDPAPRSRWARMIDAAARSGQPGTVALLAAVGMQTGDWRGVPPEHFYQIVSALRRTGLDYEARMIAAEAMTRL
jgi:hypothetical protein